MDKTFGVLHKMPRNLTLVYTRDSIRGRRIST